MSTATHAVNTSRIFRPSYTPPPAPPPRLDKAKALLLYLVYTLAKNDLLPKGGRVEKHYFSTGELHVVATEYICRLEYLLGIETDIPDGRIHNALREAAQEGNRCAALGKLNHGDRYEIETAGFNRIHLDMYTSLRKHFTFRELNDMYAIVKSIAPRA